MKANPARVAEHRSRLSREEAEAAVRTLLRWIGEDPDRPGLRGTPGRVARACEEWFGGYALDPAALLRTTFDETGGYDEVALLKDIGFVSHCEHHLAPIVGRAHVAYLPDRRVVGLSKLARVVDAFARRLQLQERMTAEIADAVQAALAPRGVAVVVEAEHHCVTTHGVGKPGSVMVTSRLTGAFRDDPSAGDELLALIGRSGPGRTEGG